MACCSLAFLHPPQRLDSCFPISNCKYSSTSIFSDPLCLSQDFEFSSPKHVPKLSLSIRLVAHPHVSPGNSSHGTPKETLKYTKSRTCSMSSSSSSSRPDSRMVDKKPGNPLGTSLVVESVRKGSKTDDRETRKRLKVRKKNPKGISEFSLDRALDGSYPAEKSSNGKIGNHGIKNRKPMKGEHTVRIRELTRKKTSRRSNKGEKTDPADMSSRIKLDICSKTGNVMGAISFYDSATRDGMKLGQYHYTVLLYLCSSAAMGVIRPAKSGSGNRSLGLLSSVSKGSSADSVNGPTIDLSSNEEREPYSEISTGKTQDDDDGDKQDCIPEPKNVEIQVSESEKHYALKRGLEIYERMRLEKIPMNEAALTSVARMAMAMGDGDMAFDMVKQMKKLGINPKLRSYGPALSVFCSNGEIEKAFEVEKHMLGCGVNPEEPELEALLKVSIDVNNAEKIYYLLHKLRVKVRSVLPSTADLIERWFRGEEASRIGKRKWNPELIRRVVESGGGGWHGQGWLGSGKWFVSRTLVGADGFCRCCGEKLALIDLDPKETEMFAESVASIAKMRERNSSFQKFQRWLDYYGPFEAVVDAANVGLFNQKKFRLSRVKAVVNGIRQMLSSKKWPLLVLHNRHLTAHKMDKPANKAITEKWRYADALYATPTGSNDDWYWLYAAIRFRCLIVTNDEMRDHTFQLLGSDFFPKWKERHQVRFSFSEIDPVFHMPPPCSVVIQESDRGHWHIPTVSEHQSEGERIWLCITRGRHSTSSKKDPGKLEESEEYKGPEAGSLESSSPSSTKQKYIAKQAQKTYRDLLSIISPEYRSILTDIEDAEDQGGCVIDFQI